MSPSAESSVGQLDAKDGVPARDPTQVVVGGRRRDALEEAPDLESPAREVRSQDRRLVGVVQLDGAERLDAPAESQLATARDADVSHPLGLAARRDQITHAADLHEVHRDDAPLARLPAAYGKVTRSVEADPEPGEERGDAVEDDVERRQPDVPALRHGHAIRVTIVRHPSRSRRAATGSGSAASAITAPPAPPPVSFPPSALAARAAATSARTSSDDTPSVSSSA